MRRNWLIGGLVASIGLNLFLLGAGATFLAMRSHERGPAASTPTPMLEAIEQLQPAHQQAFRRVLKQEGRFVAPDLKAARAARRDAARLFGEPTFDRAGVLRDLDEARQAELRARTHIETTMVDFAQGLPVAERTALAATVRRGLDASRRSLRPERRRLRQQEAADETESAGVPASDASVAPQPARAR